MMAEKIRNVPKIIKRYESLIILAIKNPTIAPPTVPTSNRTANLRFVKWSLRKPAAAPEDVAIIEIKLAAMAYRISTPNPRVRAGTTMMPPPRPSREPRKPAKTEIRMRVRLNMLRV